MALCNYTNIELIGWGFCNLAAAQFINCLPTVLCSSYCLLSSPCRFTFVFAFFLLLGAAALNDRHGEEDVYFGYYCYVVKPGVFAGGALLSLATVTLGMISYLTLTSAKNNTDQRWGNTALADQGGLAMGHPQIPPQTAADPVFVHEDTYMRRQFTWCRWEGHGDPTPGRWLPNIIPRSVTSQSALKTLCFYVMFAV